MNLESDMSLNDALQYVLDQYGAPVWLCSAIQSLAGNWTRMKDGPNYGKEQHSDDWPEDEYCVCNECLRSA